MKTSHCLLLILSLMPAWADMPQHLNGRQIQFSHCPSFKFTPLLISFGQSTSGGTYTVTSENGQNYQLQYTPDTANKTATLRVQHPHNNATINMRFETDVFGTASMNWNGIPYHDLTFRLSEHTDTTPHLARMGDPVGDVVPRCIGGNVLEINFDGAVVQWLNSQAEVTSSQPCKPTSLIIRFPKGKNAFTCTLSDGSKATAQFEHIGCGAGVELKGKQFNAEVMLDFADSLSGTATLEKFSDESTLRIRGATFRLTPAASDTACITLSDNKADTSLQQLIQDLKHRNYPTAVERLYQKRLLTLLPRILAGESVNTTLPHENNTTALHNACGLSHVEIVQWLVDHGADLNAKTAKGASPDDCIGGAKAKEVRSILRKALHQQPPR